MSFNIKDIIKTILFSTSDGVTMKDLVRLFKEYRSMLEEEDSEVSQEELKAYPAIIDEDMIKGGLEELKRELEKNDEVYRLVEGPEGYSLSVGPKYGNWVRLLRKDSRPLRLSGAAMETLALIAYRQPVTRAEIELIRGVSADSAVQKLLEHDLIQVTGQAELPGKPRLYGTTETFLKFCGIATLEELPASDVLRSWQIDEWLADSQKRELYNDEDVGLPEPEEQLVEIN